MIKQVLRQAFIQGALALDRRIGWHRLPLPLGLAVLIADRTVLREQNLHDTSSSAASPLPPSDASPSQYLAARTADGSFNDPGQPNMGRAGTRFGRNVPLQYTYPDKEPDLLEPNPRTVSLELLTRDQFVPATSLNVLAAAWLQFMIRDWFSHGKSPKENPWEIRLQEDDPWPEHPMRILRTQADPTRSPDETSPPTHINTETHWWDGSQLYGSSKEAQLKVRAGADGKLRLDEQGMIPRPLLERLGEEPGWWVGLTFLQTLFAREHNAICDRLKAAYPTWGDDELFEHARLVNAALLAKIHTVEWTPAIISHPTTRYAMRANWWGVLGERFYRLFGRITPDEVIQGIPGSPTAQHSAPYAITEEFVAVYRMHPLLPDDFVFRSAGDDRLLEEQTFPNLAGKHVIGLLDRLSLVDLAYSFGLAHPGALVLHNFPRFLQRFERPDGILQDLAATDILRSRELGVPRYNEFRRLLHLPPIASFDELTDNPTWREQLERVYGQDVERLDLTVGLFAEQPPAGFGFSDTAFRIFILMASRRLKSDRFFTTDYNARVYTREGLAWIDDSDMSAVLLRHLPHLGPALRGVENAFAPWSRVG